MNFQRPAAFGHIQVARQRRGRALELLERLEMAEFAYHRPPQLSTGQRLRLAVARALVNHPQLLLADEPTAALDATAKETVAELLQEVCRQHNAILLVSSHDPALNDRFDHIFDLDAGHLIPYKARLGTAVPTPVLPA